MKVPHGDDVQLQDEPLFLYYPIETERSGLPFLIHGPFRVNPSRTALVRGQQAHNREVLGEAVALLEGQLPGLMEEAQEIRRWLPWVLLPLVDPEADGAAGDGELRGELCGEVISLLRDSLSVPTTAGGARPECVHFFPGRPDALLVLEDMAGTGDGEGSDLRLLAAANRESYKRLLQRLGETLPAAARRIGLGEVDLESFAEALASHLGGRRDGIRVDEERATAFFLNICDLFGEGDNRGAAEILGEGGTALLPAFAGNAEGGEGELVLVPAESRRPGAAERLEKASRVVFWRPASVESRLDDVEAPPPAIPVYFMAPSVIRAEGARAEGILSMYYEEWGTTRFESRPDLFRRVADRAVELHGKPVLPVLGYLSQLLHQITSEPGGGADDLQPRPYAAVDVATLGKAVHALGSAARRPYWERLESLQRWAQIEVPVHGERGYAPAHEAVFGRAWADMLRGFVSRTERDDDAESLPEARWADAIDRLGGFREGMGRRAEDGAYPEVAAPDDERWAGARQQLARGAGAPGQMEEGKAIFDLLLLLGVRIGPAVEWRWLNTRRGAERFDELNGSMTCAASRALWAGDELDDEVPTGLEEMARSELARLYCDHVTLKPYHTFFSGGHSRGCRRNSSKKGDGGSAIAAWIWFPDLVNERAGTVPFDGRRRVAEAFREAVVASWPDVSDRVLQSGWYCCRGWHRGRKWDHAIPSLAAFQLSELLLWPALEESYVQTTKALFPAAAMVRWEKEDAPSATDAARFLPLFDARGERGAWVADDLKIDSLSETSLYGAVRRLRWLLEESGTEGDAPADCWRISEFGEVSRNVWLRAQYRLLARIVDEAAEDRWSKRAAARGGLALRARRGDPQIAVPVLVGEVGDPCFPKSLDLAFFSQSPRYWEREEHADKWILTTSSQLETKLNRWAEALGAERIPPSPPPAYTGTVVEDAEAVERLRRQVRKRLPLLLGVFKAHQAEKLDEMARTVLEGSKTLRAVDPDRSSEAGSSGLDGEGRIAFSHPAYREAMEGFEAVVLAEGIALLVDQTTAVGDLQNALGAPRRQVEQALHFRGVDLDEIVKSVSALARERLESLMQRVEGLVRGLRKASGAGGSQSMAWSRAKRSDADAMALVESLQGPEGPLADLALDGIQTAAPDLTRGVCRELLRETVDEGRSANATTRHLLAVLAGAGWSLERRKMFAESGVFDEGLDLREQRDAIDATLGVAITVALMQQLGTDELDGVEDVLDRLSSLARDMEHRLSVDATDTGAGFIGHLRDELNIPVPFEAPDSLLVEWEEEGWKRLTESLREEGGGLVSKVPEALRGVMRRCLDRGSVAPLQEDHSRELDARQRRIRRLERELDDRTLSFDAEAMEVCDPPGTVESAGTSRPGEGGGPGVTSDQAVRGRVAELFVLQVCWRRFLGLDGETREQVLEEIASHRREGSGRGDDHVGWSTKSAWEELERRLAGRRDELVECGQDAAGAHPDLRRLFKDLIGVAKERGPGYDVLDPFGVWGSAPGADNVDPRRVEVKAILRENEEDARHRVVLTTNEFHRASRDQESYVLRLISVPREPESHIEQVRWVSDIRNPVDRLKLEERIGQGVRGGTLPLVLEVRGASG